MMRAWLARLGARLGGAKTVRPAGEEAVDGRRRLLVDVSIIARDDARTGIQRVVRGILSQLMQAEPDGVRVVPVIGSRRRRYAYADPDFLATPVDIRTWRGRTVEPRRGDIFLGLDLASQILPRRTRQLRAWKSAGVTIHIVVYDLLPWLEPQWFTPAAVRSFRRWLRTIGAFADGAICISDSVARDLASWLALHAPARARAISISRIRLGSDLGASLPSSGRPGGADELVATLRRGYSVLMVGTIEPRKAHDRALAAMEHIWATDAARPVRLVIVGKAGWRAADVQNGIRSHPEMGKRLFWLEDVSDEFLEELYHCCSLLLVTSHAEGYGLPVAEALGRGCPVVARRLDVFGEIASRGISYFDDDRPGPLARVISEALLRGRPPDAVTARDHANWSQSALDLVAALNLGTPSRDATSPRKPDLDPRAG